MGFLPDFTLSSNPEITVRLREATVEDAIDFSELDPAFEEEATTVSSTGCRHQKSTPIHAVGQHRIAAMPSSCTGCTRKNTTRCQWLTSARHVKKSILFP